MIPAPHREIGRSDNLGNERRPIGSPDHEGTGSASPARTLRRSGSIASAQAGLVLKRINARHDNGIGAGSYRTTDLDGTRDPLQRLALKAAQVQRRDQVIFGALEREDNLKGLSRERFAERATQYLAQIVEWSPFRRKNVETAIDFVRG